MWEAATESHIDASRCHNLPTDQAGSEGMFAALTPIVTIVT